MKRIVTYQCEYCGLLGKHAYFIKNHEAKCDKNENNLKNKILSNRPLRDVNTGDTVVLISDRGGTLSVNLTLNKEYEVLKVEEKFGWSNDKIFTIRTDSGKLNSYVANTKWFAIKK